MNAQPLSAEVLVASGPVVAIARPDMDMLKARAGVTSRRRMRLCAHQSPDDRLHEMLIVLARHSYIRPHKHPNKTESFHIVEGEADLAIFDEDGQISDVLRMGDYGSERIFYYRLCRPYYHTVLVRSKLLAFHETTNGPFQRADTIFAPWAPEETDASARDRYMNWLAHAVEQFVSSPGSG